MGFKLKISTVVITLILAICSLFVGFAISEHASHYSKIFFYGGWARDSNDVNISYSYTQSGTKNYLYEISSGTQVWSSSFSFFKFKKVSANTTENCKITSSDYGDNGWVGLATYYVNPKTIKLNEWYHINYSHYNYTAYKRTAIHEFGHLHGLDHVDCPDEIMSNNSSRDIYQVTLGDGDKAGIVDIY